MEANKTWYVSAYYQVMLNTDEQFLSAPLYLFDKVS